MVLVIWKVDFDGDEKQLSRLDELIVEAVNEVGAKVDGPYYPQDASLLYLFWFKKYEDLSRSGRTFLRNAMKEKLPATPLRYEVCVSPSEFWGK